MYDRVVDVPRLETRVWPDRPPILDRMSRCLGRRYGVRLPVDLRQPLPRRARLRRVARRPHRPHPRRRGRGDPVARVDAHAPAAPRRRRPVHRLPDALRRPARAGRHLPAHLRALRPQARPRRPPHQRHVPRAGRELALVPARPVRNRRTQVWRTGQRTAAYGRSHGWVLGYEPSGQRQARRPGGAPARRAAPAAAAERRSVLGGAHLGGVPERAHRGDLAGRRRRSSRR